MKKTVFLASLLALTFTGCSNDYEMPNEQSQSDLIPISVKEMMEIPEGTRAAYTGNTPNATKPFHAYVLVSETNGDYSTLYQDTPGNTRYSVEWVSTNNTGFYEGVYYYPQKTSIMQSLYVCGFYPYSYSDGATTVGWAANGGIPTLTGGNSIVGTIDGKTDLLAAPQVQATVGIDGSVTQPTLTFAHLGTWLTIKVKAKTNRDKTATQWGKLKGIEVNSVLGKSIANKATLSLSTGTAVWNGTQTALPTFNSSDQPFNNAALDIPLEATEVSYVILPAFTSTQTNDFSLSVTTTKASVDKTTTIPVSLNTAANTAGKHITLTLSFGGEGELQILPSVAITKWTDENASADI
ncbi:MAG: fimbrillin family protein [Mediterranea sp.]|jgi:hypothetical protein|nr:fimbrillin family protein [Mediterranea sp.]